MPIGENSRDPETGVFPAKIEQSLKNLGIEFPSQPDPESSEPRQWLVRGESQVDKLHNPIQARFEPQTGEWARFGVFLADCASALMYPQSGAWYVYNRDNFPMTEWLSTQSADFNQKITEVAKNKGLDVNTIKGGVAAETELYHQFDVYDPQKGITTFHEPLPLQRASHILVTEDVAEKLKDSQLPKWLAAKLVVLH